MQSLFEKDDPQALLHAATLGDEVIAREFLNKFKNEVEFVLTVSLSRRILYKWFACSI